VLSLRAGGKGVASLGAKYLDRWQKNGNFYNQLNHAPSVIDFLIMGVFQ
jgi:hypothetical protein